MSFHILDQKNENLGFSLFYAQHVNKCLKPHYIVHVALFLRCKCFENSLMMIIKNQLCELSRTFSKLYPNIKKICKSCWHCLEHTIAVLKRDQAGFVRLI